MAPNRYVLSRHKFRRKSGVPLSAVRSPHYCFVPSRFRRDSRDSEKLRRPCRCRPPGGSTATRPIRTSKISKVARLETKWLSGRSLLFLLAEYIYRVRISSTIIHHCVSHPTIKRRRPALISCDNYMHATLLALSYGAFVGFFHGLSWCFLFHAFIHGALKVF